jgi:2'-5' RNA ligase
MSQARYALVAYVRNHVGEFVENLRRELHPSLPYFSAHVSILPPRCLKASELTIRQYLEEACSPVDPFFIELGEVASFVPTTPTLFIRVARGAYRMRELNYRLHRPDLFEESQWVYMPHLTIAKMDSEAQARAGFALASERWQQYNGSHRIRIDELTFVREDGENHWTDLASVPLGHRLVPSAG